MWNHAKSKEASMTREVAARIQSTEVKENDGQISKGGHAARAAEWNDKGSISMADKISAVSSQQSAVSSQQSAVSSQQSAVSNEWCG